MSRLILRTSLLNNIQNIGALSVISNSATSTIKFGKNKYEHIRWYSGSSGVLTSPYGSQVKIPDENLVEHVYKQSSEWADEPATTCAVSGRSYSYGMLRMLINRCAQALLSHCRLQPKDVVGILMPNIPEFIIVCHGAMEAGLVVSFINPLYTPDEIKRQFQNAGVKLIITIPQLMEAASIIAPTLDDCKGTLCVGGEDNPEQNVYGLQSLLMGGHEAKLPKLQPNDLAILPYSSGTVGLPKGVMLSHRNLVANLVQVDHPEFMDPFDKSGKKAKVFTVLPYFHIYGHNAILNLCLKKGLHIVTIPRFTPEDYIKTLVEQKPAFLFVVPSLLLFLATHPAVKKEHLQSIEKVTSGAAPLTQNIVEKFKEKIGRDDVWMGQGYGMTETSPVTFLMPQNVPKSKLQSIGQLVPGTEAKIIDLESGEVLGKEQPGELLIKGPQVMLGYLNNEEATANTIDKNGWLHTGDVAYYDDDQYFHIVDRTKELIKVKGNQVSPTEIENILLEMPGVVDVAVVGIPDTIAGEIPRAFIVKKPDSNLEESDVLSYFNPKVIHYKKLGGGVRFVETIPRNASGKILRRELAKMN